MAGHNKEAGSQSGGGAGGHQTATQKKITQVVVDIMFGTVILYLVYLYIGFRVPYVQENQWFVVSDKDSTGHMLHTLFSMVMAVVTREISGPIATMANTVFAHVTQRVPWRG